MSVLSYLKLPDAKYIPKYSSLDAGNELNIAQNIQRQQELGQQKYTQFDNMVLSAFEGANETQKQFITDKVNQLTAGIQPNIESGDYRGISSVIPRMTSDFIREVTPIRESIQRRKEYKAQLIADQRMDLDTKQALISNLESNQDLTFDGSRVLPNWVNPEDYLLKLSQFIEPEVLTNIVGTNDNGQPITQTIKNMSPDMVQNKLIPYAENHGPLIQQSRFFFDETTGTSGVVQYNGTEYNLENPTDRAEFIEVQAKDKVREDIMRTANLLSSTEEGPIRGGSTSRNGTIINQATGRANSNITSGNYQVTVPLTANEKVDDAYATFKTTQYDDYNTEFIDISKTLGKTLHANGYLVNPNNEYEILQVTQNGTQVPVNIERNAELYEMLYRRNSLNQRLQTRFKDLEVMNNIALDQFRAKYKLSPEEVYLDSNGQFVLKSEKLNGQKANEDRMISDYTIAMEMTEEYSPDSYKREFENIRNNLASPFFNDTSRETVGYSFDTTDGVNNPDRNFVQALENNLSNLGVSDLEGTPIAMNEFSYERFVPGNFALSDENGNPFVFGYFVDKEGVKTNVRIQGSMVNDFVNSKLSRSEQSTMDTIAQFSNTIFDRIPMTSTDYKVNVDLDTLQRLGLNKIELYQNGNPVLFDGIQNIEVQKTASGYTFDVTYPNGSKNRFTASSPHQFMTRQMPVIQNDIKMLLSNEMQYGGVENPTQINVEGISNEIGFLNQPTIEGGMSLEPHVPMRDGRAIDNSGITIGRQIDLGQQNAVGLRSLGVSEEIIQQLEPYFGLSKEAAVRKLDEAKANINLTEEQLAQLSDAVLGGKVSSIKRNIPNYDSLPQPAKNVVTSLFYQFGLAGAMRGWRKDVIDAITNGRYAIAASILESQESYRERRVAEAQELRRA